MSDLNFKERLVNALKGKPVDKVPVVSVTQTGIVELMDATGASWPEAHSDPEKMAALALAGHDLTRLEAVRYPYCVTVLAEAMGCKVNMGTKDIQPSVISHPFAEGPENLQVPKNLVEKARIPAVLRATDLLKEKVGENVPIIAGMEGPATLFSHLAGVDNYLTWFIQKPDYITQFLSIATDACIEYANTLLEYGADVICVSDGVGGPDLLNPEMFESFLKPEYQRFCRNVKGIKIMHMCGNANPILKSLAECGFEGISVEEKVKDLKAAKEIIGNKSSLIGNVSTSVTMLNGTYDQVKEEAKKCLTDGVDVLAPGCGIAPRTPFENVKALVRARDEYYAQKDFSPIKL
ncbi:methylcobamide:CoM methyltransferase MtaA [Methanococcoides alaskense]|uniref:[methyl-Co(III) methanol-specific corrinoid protein]:coenzyme M methyltransferase n=1 Tax=Methanococcoides alaskense TaxID=325778 RepID=A0AA90Z5V7_9EURY|nr:methylcobamide:CoM methyltransferase MtaA [Methanococcoides alaskense]MDA0525481.1 methylcobamide:CoM methyltransferase MtaA [Methanococcoides alaskense]MDR6221584.1 [methyl-Co(III) methanol-specific corrinoid protein]:coenzyme M methyltransferase [Methanococcoides alaskense]